LQAFWLNQVTMSTPGQDLHRQLRITPTPFKYAEVYFNACFEEIFPHEGAFWETKLNGTEVMEILQLLDISYNRDYMIKSYTNPKNHNTEVYHSANDPCVFAFFDLYKDPTDQNDMFLFGISFERKDESIILQKILDIYRQLGTASPFSYDLLNKQLYNKVFKSSFYFYTGNYAKYDKQIIHHNLNTET